MVEHVYNTDPLQVFPAFWSDSLHDCVIIIINTSVKNFLFFNQNLKSRVCNKLIYA